MADPNNNSGNNHLPDEAGSSTISYLPILFANGYPTSLERMTVEQLELFIPFLVKCSLNLKNDEELKTLPKWWPPNLDFRVPFDKPKDFKKNWDQCMRNLIITCYDYHKQPFLLRYSKDLCTHDTANLRYVRDSATTTELWSRHPKKLLLTFRNELMLYDKKKRRQLWKKDESVQEHEEAEFDIFLCDNCDATFVSEEAYTEHEKKCNAGVESEKAVENIVISDEEPEEEEEEEDVDEIDQISGQTDFMAYLYLANVDASELPRRTHSLIERSLSPKKKKQAPRTRKTISQKDREREFTIPFSSPAGLVLTKKGVDENYAARRLELIEDYCQAKPTTKISRTKVKYPQNSTETLLMKQIKRTRPYYWPKTHLHSKSREENFNFLNRWLIEDCKPLSIVALKLSDDGIRAIQENLKRLKEAKANLNCVDLISDSDDDSVEFDDGVKEDMMKLNGQFLAMPLPAKPLSSKLLTNLNRIPQFTQSTSKSTLVPNNEHEFGKSINSTANNNTTTTTKTTIIQQKVVVQHTTPEMNGRLSENHINSRTYDWLNNLNGENFKISTQQLKVINS